MIKKGATKKLPNRGMTLRGDWHPAEIVAALHKRGVTLRALSRANGYSSPSTLSQALQRRWPKGERIIASAIGVHPRVIWPSRYPQEVDREV